MIMILILWIFNSFRHYAFLNMLVIFNRIFASDTRGTINVWDKRGKILPCLEFTSASHDILNSIQLSADNQVRNCFCSLENSNLCERKECITFVLVHKWFICLTSMNLHFCRVFFIWGVLPMVKKKSSE